MTVQHSDMSLHCLCCAATWSNAGFPASPPCVGVSSKRKAPDNPPSGATANLATMAKIIRLALERNDAAEIAVKLNLSTEEVTEVIKNSELPTT